MFVPSHSETRKSSCQRYHPIRMPPQMLTGHDSRDPRRLLKRPLQPTRPWRPRPCVPCEYRSEQPSTKHTHTTYVEPQAPEVHVRIWRCHDRINRETKSIE